MAFLFSLRALPGWVFQRWISLVALACLAFVFWLCLIGTDRFFMAIIVPFVWIAGGFIVGFIAVLIHLQPGAKKFDIALPDQKTIAVAFTISATIVVTQWPLRAAFALSRPALEQAAQAMTNGGTISTPRFVGVLWVQHAEVSRFSQTPCFWLDNHPSGRSGFVQGTPNTAQRFNLWSTQEIASGWQLVSED